MVKQPSEAVLQRITAVSEIIDALNDAVWIIDKDLNVLEINDIARETVFGHITDKLSINFYALEGLTEYEQQVWSELYERCLNGEQVTVDIKNIHIKHQILSVTIKPIKADNGILGAVITAKDITAIKATRERLRKLYREHKFISQLMQEIYKITDWKSALSTLLEKISNIMTVTCAYLQITDTEIAKFEDNYVIRYNNHKQHCRCLEKLSKPLIDLIQQQIYLSYNSKQEITDGLHLTENIQQAQAMFIYPIRMMNQVIGFLGFADCLHAKRWQGDELIFITTISEIISSYIVQQISQDNISNSYRITMNVMDNLNAIVTVTDIKSYRVLFANKFAKEKFGNIEGSICWSNAKINATEPCDNCEIAELLTMNEGDILYREVQNEVNNCWYHTSNSLISWTDGRKAHLQIAVDISDRIEMENKLRNTAEELMETNRTKDKFFSIIAHDLKNPFMGLMGFSEILMHKSRQMSIADIEECSALIHEAAKNAQQLLQNLLVWSQSQTGKLKFQPEPVDLELLANNSLESVKLLANQKQIILNKDFDNLPPLTADVNMLTTIIRNLLTNAVKFTNEKGTVTLKISSDHNNVSIVVSDTGIGLTGSEIEKLFRVDVSNKSIGNNAAPGSKGTGLGLILCREFVIKHGGTITVASEYGKGSSFTVNLPLTPLP